MPNFSPEDRILILAPHPDDEVLGCGGIVQKAIKAGASVKVLFFTYGDNNEWSFMVYRKRPVLRPKSVQAMGLVRHDEAGEAAKILGLSPDQLIFLGYPDFRTLNIWHAHWGDSPPAHSMFTEVTAVPYANALHPGSPYKGEPVLSDLVSVFLEFKPTKIFVSHPSDTNVDHRALYLFTRVALWDLEDKIQPELYPYLIHHKHWPIPSGLHTGERINPPMVLSRKIPWIDEILSPEEIEKKHTAITKHESQYNVSASYLLSFVRANELFGDLPYVVLKPNEEAISLTNLHPDDANIIPEELVGDERKSFVAIQEQHALLMEDTLNLSLKLTRPIGKAIAVSVRVFGYRKDKSFSDMPKLHFKFGVIEHWIFDQHKKLPNNSIQVTRNAEDIKIVIPIDLLGNPQKILASAMTSMGEMPLDRTSWRVLEIER